MWITLFLWGGKKGVQELVNQINSNRTSNIFECSSEFPIDFKTIDDTFFFILLRSHNYQKNGLNSTYQTLLIGHPEVFYIMGEYKTVSYADTIPYPRAYYKVILNGKKYDFNASLSFSKDFRTIVNGTSCKSAGMYINRIFPTPFTEQFNKLWTPSPSLNIERYVHSPAEQKISMKRGGCLIEVSVDYMFIDLSGYLLIRVVFCIGHIFLMWIHKTWNSLKSNRTSFRHTLCCSLTSPW